MSCTNQDLFYLITRRNRRKKAAVTKPQRTATKFSRRLFASGSRHRWAVIRNFHPITFQHLKSVSITPPWPPLWADPELGELTTSQNDYVGLSSCVSADFQQKPECPFHRNRGSPRNSALDIRMSHKCSTESDIPRCPPAPCGLGSHQANILKINKYRPTNRCFLPLYCSFRPQNERYRPKYRRCGGHILPDMNKLPWTPIQIQQFTIR